MYRIVAQCAEFDKIVNMIKVHCMLFNREKNIKQCKFTVKFFSSLMYRMVAQCAEFEQIVNMIKVYYLQSGLQSLM